MNKKFTKPYAKNARLDIPHGLIGVPPDLRYKNVMVIAKLTDAQYNAMVDALADTSPQKIPQ
jgi:hypothetical protein